MREVRGEQKSISECAIHWSLRWMGYRTSWCFSKQQQNNTSFLVYFTANGLLHESHRHTYAGVTEHVNKWMELLGQSLLLLSLGKTNGSTETSFYCQIIAVSERNLYHSEGLSDVESDIRHSMYIFSYHVKAWWPLRVKECRVLREHARKQKADTHHEFDACGSFKLCVSNTYKEMAEPPLYLNMQ